MIVPPAATIASHAAALAARHWLELGSPRVLARENVKYSDAPVG